jgi:predicted transcriptional regulator
MPPCYQKDSIPSRCFPDIYSRVRVRALVGLGLVELAKTGRNKAPRVRFEKITLEIAV